MLLSSLSDFSLDDFLVQANFTLTLWRNRVEATSAGITLNSNYCQSISVTVSDSVVAVN